MMRAVASLSANNKALGDSTYATLLASYSASAYSGYTARVTDIGVPCLWMYSDGTRWVPAWPQTLARSAATVTAPTDTNENALFTVNIAANLLGINGRVEIYAGLNITNNANAKTLRARLGGIAGTQMVSASLASIGGAGILWTVANRGATNSQAGGAGNYGVGAGGVGTGALDTTAAQDLVLSAQKTTAGDTIALEFYTVTVKP